MKCKNCGGNYKLLELRCPYCETENVAGRFLIMKRTDAIKRFEAEQKEAKKKYVPYVLSKLVNRVILFSFIGIVVMMILSMNALPWYKKDDTGIYNQTMVELHDEGKYMELYYYLDRKDLYGRASYIYTQSALLANTYDDFITRRSMYLSDDANNWSPDYVAMVMDDAMKIYAHNIGMYKDDYPENHAQYELCNQRILAFWKGTMMCTDDEVAWLADPENSWHSDVLRELCETLKERRIATYGK